jgi:hypothetical protein
MGNAGSDGIQECYNALARRTIVAQGNHRGSSSEPAARFGQRQPSSGRLRNAECCVNDFLEPNPLFLHFR